MLLKEDADMRVQSFSANHVDALVRIEGLDSVRFSSLYGYSELSQRHLSWELLRNINKNVSEDWVIGGDFNEIMDENEKYGGRRKSKAVMDEFRGVVKELALVDVKSDKGWFT